MQDRVPAAIAAFFAGLLLASCNTSNSANTTSSTAPGASAAAGSPAAVAAAGGYFSAAQAASGATVYAGKCASCHGATLQGQSGPSLTGARFAKSLQAYGTGETMYNFISKQMPANAPGSLSTANYLAVTAYLLQQNGYPSGSHPLDATTLASVNLSNAVSMAAASPGGGAGNTNEIVRAAPPTTVDYGAPAGNVNVSDAMMGSAASDNADWLLDGRTYDNERYSPLSQINVGTVSTLTPVAIVQTGMTASFETTPIVVGGTMYITTPVVSSQMKIMALNAATGERIWETTYNLGSFQICCGPVNRGVAVGYGKVYAVTLDDNLLALDATNGKVLCAESNLADPTLGYSETMAPQIYDGTVYVGSAGGEWAFRGFVAAFDANTGGKKWQWRSTDPKSYLGDSWKTGGAMLWTRRRSIPSWGFDSQYRQSKPDLFGRFVARATISIAIRSSRSI